MNNNDTLYKISHTLSYMLHPMLLMLLTMMLVSYLAGSSWGFVFLDLLILAAGLAPGMGYIIWKTRRGDFSHYHLLLKEERFTVFPLMIVGLLGSVAAYYFLGRPVQFIEGGVVGIIGGIGAAVINRFWKMSIHAGVAAGCVGLLWFISLPWAAVMGLLALLSGLARIPIKHHTPLQVLVGWLYGFGLTVLLWRLLFQ